MLETKSYSWRFKILHKINVRFDNEHAIKNELKETHSIVQKGHKIKPKWYYVDYFPPNKFCWKELTTNEVHIMIDDWILGFYVVVQLVLCLAIILFNPIESQRHDELIHESITLHNHE